MRFEKKLSQTDLATLMLTISRCRRVEEWFCKRLSVCWKKSGCIIMDDLRLSAARHGDEVWNEVTAVSSGIDEAGLGVGGGLASGSGGARGIGV